MSMKATEFRWLDDINVQACTCDSLYYHKIFIFAVLERWLIYDCETECSFVYLILDGFCWKFNSRTNGEKIVKIGSHLTKLSPIM